MHRTFMRRLAPLFILLAVASLNVRAEREANYASLFTEIKKTHWAGVMAIETDSEQSAAIRASRKDVFRQTKLVIAESPITVARFIDHQVAD